MYSPDKMISSKPLGAPISSNGPAAFTGRYSPTYRSPDPMRRCMNNAPVSFSSVLLPYQKGVYTNSFHDSHARPLHEEDYKPLPLAPQTQLFGAGLDDGLLTRAEALAAVDISKHGHGQPPGAIPQLKHDMMYHPGMATTPHTPPISRTNQVGSGEEAGAGGGGGGWSHKAGLWKMGHHSMDGLEMLDPISSSSMTTLTPMSDGSSMHQLHGAVYTHSPMNSMMPHPGLTHPHMPLSMHDTDTDPRELEAFAERFKQRRIKLGVTQADVGKALANLKLPGVGALSQSTICRFESLTLSHNNMIALKPVLQAWLEEAEAQAKNKRRDPEAPSVLPMGEKRKRTSIAAPEKRSLEAYFAVQPRPSGEKIAAIAEKLDLKKNVVRVWFCNQRQKQKRMKFAATQKQMTGGNVHTSMGSMMTSPMPPHTPVP
ncbi:inhibitory POU protein-like isoform X2 [Eriocheir sinensis]|uniref:inhibitory POU protein-like isoform X2 n=1 Tax=Eriocheir sinensis TaxID=95602 RepID=UPI0021C67F1C|nr:inhibitory POU protein-like isoform X2 [Eriocheir sinensis]